MRDYRPGKHSRQETYQRQDTEALRKALEADLAEYTGTISQLAPGETGETLDYRVDYDDRKRVVGGKRKPLRVKP